MGVHLFIIHFGFSTINHLFMVQRYPHLWNAHISVVTVAPPPGSPGLVLAVVATPGTTGR